MKIVAQNKKAFHDYHVLDTLEAGIVLTGDEVKSIRAGKVSLKASYAIVHVGELYLLNCHIAGYEKAYIKEDEANATRRRKLLVHKKQLAKLIGDISKKGITIVPLKMYFNKTNKLKVELGICKHKLAAGKKQALKEQDIRRETSKEMKNFFRN